MYLRLVLVPGNFEEENKFILVKVMVSLDNEVWNTASKRKHKHKKMQT